MRGNGGKVGYFFVYPLYPQVATAEKVEKALLDYEASLDQKVLIKNNISITQLYTKIFKLHKTPYIIVLSSL